MVESSVQDSFDDRLAAEVTALSTNLVTAVAKSSELEETVFHLHKENNQLKAQKTQLLDTADKYKKLLEEHTKLQTEFKETKEKEEIAVAQNSKLQGEVEDLTASLFNEANEMVSNASRETYNFKVKNRKLIEEIEEKDTIIKDLQEQLSDLKQLFIKVEHKNRMSTPGTTPSLEQDGFNGSKNDPTSNEEIENDEETAIQLQLSSVLYSPSVRSIRLDLKQFQTEFRAFIYHLIKPNFQFDLQNLKTLKFFKKIWNDELENSITAPHTSTSNFINRWQKGKSFWNFIVEGKAIIEPIKGVNETFKLTYAGQSSHNEPPVATRLPCSFCGESRDDVLDHCRLYSLKLLSSEVNTTTSDVNDSYGNPLCNYCLIKLRNICDFFAKLRLIHSNIYKLSQTNQFDDVGIVPNISNNFQFRKNSATSTNDNEKIETTTSKIVKLPVEEEGKLIKLYIMLTMIRTKIFWSKIGFWDTINNVTIANLDEINHEVFQTLVRDEESGDQKAEVSNTITIPSDGRTSTTSETADRTEKTDKDLHDAENTANESEINISPKKHEIEDVETEELEVDKKEDETEASEPIEVISVTSKDDVSNEAVEATIGISGSQHHIVENSELSVERQHSNIDRAVASHNESDDQNANSTDNEEEFLDSTEDYHDKNEESSISNKDNTEPETNLKRKKSKSKQFKKKMDDDLNQTLAMLEESIHE